MSGPLAWRMIYRELRSGELRVLFAALCIAVAAVSAVGFLGGRIAASLESEAQQMLGGDLVLASDQPVPAEFVEGARQRGLRIAQTQVFPSMLLAGEQAQLVEIKAVAGAYPLFGELQGATVDASQMQVLPGVAPGAVWADERLILALQLRDGQRLTLGRSQLPLAGRLLREPDAGINPFAVAPRLLMHVDDVAASGLIQFGSRVRYRLLLAGPPAALADWRSWAEARLQRGQRLETVENARPEVRTALDRAQRFLGLATLLTVVLSAIAVVLATRRYLQRHLDACAMLRCLGATQARLLGLHLSGFALLAGLATVVGTLLGFVAHFGLLALLGGLLADRLPWPGWRPVGEGGLVAAVLLFGFALPPLLQLARVPTLRVLRRELGAPALSAIVAQGLGVIALGWLIYRAAGDARLGSVALGGFTLALLVFFGLARATIALLGRLRFGQRRAWQLGLLNLTRHATANALKISALAVGLMALLLLAVTRQELVSAWRASLPADAPNRFVINIQPEQRVAVSDWLAERGIAAELAPMVRARLLRINERAVGAADYPDDERAQRLVEREFNLSWRSDLPPGNTLTAGKWFAADPDAKLAGEASVEAGLAKTLGIALGDRLGFSVGGIEQTVTVTSLRRLDWDSMRVNFFVLMPPATLSGAPASYITSFRLPAERRAEGAGLVATYPNLTLIDIDAVLSQIQGVVDQVVGAVQFVFLFTLLAGIAVLYAALWSSADERQFELAVMRALGARRQVLRQALLVELAVIGGLAGTIAAFGAAAVGQVLARQVFQIEPALAVWPVAGAALLGALATLLLGWLGLRRLLVAPPLLALREGA